MCAVTPLVTVPNTRATSSAKKWKRTKSLRISKTDLMVVRISLRFEHRPNDLLAARDELSQVKNQNAQLDAAFKDKSRALHELQKKYHSLKQQAEMIPRLAAAAAEEAEEAVNTAASQTLFDGMQDRPSHWQSRPPSGRTPSSMLRCRG